MFWKKKKPDKESFVYESKNFRNAFRYHFKQDQHIDIRFKGKIVGLLNISAGGMAFKNNGFTLFELDSVDLKLDLPNNQREISFPAELRIIHIDGLDICHANFQNCSLKQHELIHKYVHEMQKHDLAH